MTTLKTLRNGNFNIQPNIPTNIHALKIQRLYDRSDKDSKSSKSDHHSTDDIVAVEEPLEIRLGYYSDRSKARQNSHQKERRSLSITMRTPGEDEELAAGFLFTEGIIQHPEQIEEIVICGKPTGPHGLRNVVRVELAKGVSLDWQRLQRNFYTTSSCGVCGKSSLEALQHQLPAVLSSRNSHHEDDFQVEASTLFQLPKSFKQHQLNFQQTGGVHATALYNHLGQLQLLREDVGRHNAMDKLIGHLLLAQSHRLPTLARPPTQPPSQQKNFLLVSGRLSFELMQKAVMAGFNFIVGFGAPSSLAVEIAKKYQMTLVGLLKEERMNIYYGEWRINGT